MKAYHEIANKMNLTGSQRTDYFTLAAEIQNRKTVKLGVPVSDEYAHKLAFGALEEADWDKTEAGELLTADRTW